MLSEIEWTDNPIDPMTDRVAELAQQLAVLGGAHSEQKVDVLNQFACETNFQDIERRRGFAAQTMESAQEFACPRGIAWSLFNQGTHDFFVGAFDAALSKELETINLFGDLEDEEEIGSAPLGRGLVYWSIG